MRTTLPVVGNSILLKAGLNKIRSGDILSVKIKNNNKGLIKAVINGQSINIKGFAMLKTGQVVRVRAEWRGKTLFLNILDDKTDIKNILIENGVKSNSISLFLFEAAKRADLHLKDENVRLLKRMLSRKKDLSREESRTAAESIKKGISPEEMSAVAGFRDCKEKNERDKTLLFNQLTAGDDHWFIIPYSFSADDNNLQGSIRIKKNIRMKKITTVIIEIDVEDGRIFFQIEDYNTKKCRIHVFADGTVSESLRKKIIKGLPEILGNLPLNFDDNINKQYFVENCESMEFDGFSTAESIPSGIEEVV